MTNINHTIERFRAMLVMALYVVLSLFCLMLVMVTVKYLPAANHNTSLIVIIFHMIVGMVACINGLRFTLILNRRLKAQTAQLKVDDLIYLPHLLPLSVFFFLTTIVLK